MNKNLPPGKGPTFIGGPKPKKPAHYPTPKPQMTNTAKNRMAVVKQTDTKPPLAY